MRQVLDGKLYDTQKAKVVYKDNKSEDKRQLWQMISTQSFFFTFADGHIEPITRPEAEKYLGLVDVDVYIQMFGEPQEG